MFIPASYFLAVFFCIITMLCWGSWANTQKLATGRWAFPLFYWDYTIGIVLLSLAGGVLMGFFFRFVAASVSPDFVNPAPGLLTPYSAVFIFSVGVFASNFLWNTIFMYKPIKGEAVSYGDYFRLGNPRLHAIGILGGIIWCIGMSLSMIASEQAGFAISYGLGQGATMVAAAWGVFVWKEFARAPRGTTTLINLMFFFFIAGLVLIILARVL